MRAWMPCTLAAVLATPLAAQEKQETIGGWSLEERRNPQEPRDYSVVLSRKVGEVELVTKRGTVRGREAHLVLGDCTDVSFGNLATSSSIAEQIQSIRENVASSYTDSRKDCRLGRLPPALLTGFDEAYRAADARFRANRPPSEALDRALTVGGWTLTERRDDDGAGEPGKRIISMTKTLDGLELRQTVKADLFFHDLFFSDHAVVTQFSDCRREQPLEKLGETGGPPETAAQRKALIANLAEVEKDCQLPHETAIALLSDYAPAFTTLATWTRQRIADRAALDEAAQAYESRLADQRWKRDNPSASNPASEEAARLADEAAAAAQGCAVDAATGRPDC